MRMFDLDPEKANAKSPLPQFLRRNPFPRPLTLGFFYREKMRAIHRIAPDTVAGPILEVGGGRGGLTSLLYPNNSVVNIDLMRPWRRRHRISGRPCVLFVVTLRSSRFAMRVLGLLRCSICSSTCQITRRRAKRLSEC
jgi:hypothetical protein